MASCNRKLNPFGGPNGFVLPSAVSGFPMDGKPKMRRGVAQWRHSSELIPRIRGRQGIPGFACWSLFFQCRLSAMVFLHRLSLFVLKNGFANGPGHSGGFAGPASLVQFLQFASQDIEGPDLVLVLASFGLTGDGDPGGAVAQPYGRFAAVDVLSARSAGTERFDIAFGEEFVVGGRDEDGGHNGRLFAVFFVLFHDERPLAGWAPRVRAAETGGRSLSRGSPERPGSPRIPVFSS